MYPDKSNPCSGELASFPVCAPSPHADRGTVTLNCWLDGRCGGGVGWGCAGKIYKKLNLTSQAMMNFSLALDLKPTVTDVNHIKSAIDKLAVPQEETEEEL
jgi:hypothetical protein